MMSSAMEKVETDARIVALREFLGTKRDSEVHVKEASHLLSHAQLQLDKDREQVLAEAYAEGYNLGIADAENEIKKHTAKAEQEWRTKFEKENARMTSAAKKLESMLNALPVALADIENRVEELTVEATFAAIARIVGSVASDQETLLKFCRDALSEHTLRPATLRVHPDYLHVIRDVLQEENIRIEADHHLTHTECRIENAKGLYDVSLEHRLESLKQGLLASLSISHGYKQESA